MRKSLVFVLVLVALFVMPGGRTVVSQYAIRPLSAPLFLRPLQPLQPKIIFMGDSVTMGAFASTPDNAYVERVHKYLQSRGIDDTNFCLWTLTPASDLRVAELVASSKRDIVMVEVGVHWDMFDAAQFRELYGAMLDCLTASGARLVVGTIPWLNWRPDTPSYYQMAFFSQIIREEAAKRGIPVADLWAATDNRPDAVSRPGQACYLVQPCRGDNYHPGDVGHALIAEAYEKALDKALAAPAPAATNRCDLGPYVNVLTADDPVPAAP
jgi:lysophospholipase L1-like esterase